MHVSIEFFFIFFIFLNEASLFDWTKVALKIKSLHFALQAHLLGHSDA